jgi:hypothetical protein
MNNYRDELSLLKSIKSVHKKYEDDLYCILNVHGRVLNYEYFINLVANIFFDSEEH